MKQHGTQTSLPLQPEASSRLRTRAERHAAGAQLRKSVCRTSQAEWAVRSDRTQPAVTLAAQGKTRIQELLPIRYARMKASPFAFLRGAAAVMAADLAHTPSTGLTVQACGDCHLANFGSYASPEGVPVFDINDFDETLTAPFEWDIKRLGTSLVLAGLESGMSDKAARALPEEMALTYTVQMTRLAELSPIEIWTDRIDLTSAVAQFEDRKVRARVQAELTRRLDSARNHFGLVADNGPAPSLRECPPLVMRLPAEEDTIRHAFARYCATQPPERLALLDRYRLKDVVFKVVGIGSVGTFCAIGLFATADSETLLLQIKEARTSVLAPFTAPDHFHNQGERVVTGQRITQAVSDSFLGWTHSDGPQSDATGTAPDLSGAGRQFYVRRLKDSRLAAIGADFAQQGLTDYAKLCGRTLARAHARSGDVVAIAGYIGKGTAFANAISAFSAAYAKQTHRDWAAFTAALKGNNLTVPPASV
ncbi:DUF2252 domain-containing protein [Acetobacter oeni]|uniref:DUF2252 domain-containing protein n=1 Tax=Acetobacter oeni TaxID=304077 RepID=A0A511XN83_9PROT|nr:DUF2252 domain-containing protein [Acetobacter oeni]MBB3884269.1 uncharacterized protein (DUF2252 family) [Acetobacter oeni]NHO20212.1 DUF2252 domain-containing protein [Acetobacter oeni]GEN64411.1 hypothetical protein AOE01nite_26350 [Acetobacter oeni]